VRVPSPLRKLPSRLGLSTVVLATTLLLTGCPSPQPPASARKGLVRTTTPENYQHLFNHREVGAGLGSIHPWIAHVKAVDLDQDGLMDILACEAQLNQILWIRQVAPGRFEERVIAENVLAPVRAEVADMNGNGHLDVLVSVMGYVFPNNDRIGEVLILENDGRQNFTPRVVLKSTSRVTDIRAGDFNGDGQMDLAVGQFGYDQGEIRWLERVGPWEFRPHVLLELSGAINVLVADFTGNGHSDIIALISQQWEEIYLFENQGGGKFTRKRIWGSTNEDYGSSGINMADMNGNGRLDILYTNGDGFGPAAQPGPRPWHGVQWLENLGGGLFRYHRVGDLPGAYSPVGVDVDGDGRMDIVASSAYADWDKRQTEPASLMWFRNDGRGGFTPRLLARVPKDLITLDAGDFTGDGLPELVTGGFYVAPPYEKMGRVLLWERNEPTR
jgi:hypothetical protein